MTDTERTETVRETDEGTETENSTSVTTDEGTEVEQTQTVREPAVEDNDAA